ncbi:MAG: NTPase [Candidatus Micrarchaeota archaeon]
MPRNFFITGLPKAGKTTVLRKVVEELKKRGVKVGGFITPDQSEHGTRQGFWVQDLRTGQVAELASTKGGGPRVGRYEVKVGSFESIAIPAMNAKADVIIIDEIGRMEMKSRKFVDLLDKVLESKTPVIASINEEFVATYGFSGEIFLVTPTNREDVYMELLAKATEEYAEPTVKKPQTKAKPVKGKTVKKAKGKPAKKSGKKVVPAKKAKPAAKAHKAEPEKKHETHEPHHKRIIRKLEGLIGL